MLKKNVNSCKFNIFHHFQRATWQKLAAQSLEVSLRGRQCQHDWLPIQSYPEKSEAFCHLLSQAKEQPILVRAALPKNLQP